MGVQKLYTFIKVEKAYNVIDLIEIARNGNIKILVDMHAFSRYIVEISLQKIAKDYSNDFLLFPVGEYDIMGEVYYDFHMSFKDAGIVLVWVVDGHKVIEKKFSKQKESIWKINDQTSIKKRNAILNACSQKEKPPHLNYCSPIIDLESGLEQLKSAEAEIIHLLEGDADDYIASLYNEGGYYAILTNDTDFVLFENCNVIFGEMFSLCYDEDVLKLPFIDQDTPGKVFKTATSFKCAVTNSDHVIKALELDSYDQLISVSILKGNDFTTEHCQSVARLIGLEFLNITMVASYVKSKNIIAENIKNIEQIKEYLVNNPDFLDSIDYSYQFFSLKHINPDAIFNPKNDNECLTYFLAEKISTGKINRYCYGIHHGCYFETICTEELPKDCASIMVLLEDIRSRIYPYLLNKNRNKVSEWRSRLGKFVDVDVTHEDIQANEIKGIPDGLKIFERIWSHDEPETLDYVERFGEEKSLILYMLRYLYKRNKGINLDLLIHEFTALFVTVFYQFSAFKGGLLTTTIPRDTFLRMKICPSSRCLTIVTWFMNLYYTAKYICGGALDLTDRFPAPATIMNGSTLFAFYETIAGDGTRANHLSPELKTDLDHLKREILEIFREEYDIVVEQM